MNFSINNQSKLTKNRLSNMGIATIAYRVGANVVNGLDAVQKNILAQKLGFDDDGIAQIVVDENLNNKETIIIKEHQDDLTKSVPEHHLLVVASSSQLVATVVLSQLFSNSDVFGSHETLRESLFLLGAVIFRYK